PCGVYNNQTTVNSVNSSVIGSWIIKNAKSVGDNSLINYNDTIFLVNNNSYLTVLNGNGNVFRLIISPSPSLLSQWVILKDTNKPSSSGNIVDGDSINIGNLGNIGLCTSIVIAECNPNVKAGCSVAGCGSI